MAPSHHGAIQSRPRRGLVWHVAHDSGRTVLQHGQLLHSRQDAIGQDNLSAHVLAAVVRFMRSVADIDQCGFYVGRVTVVGQADWVGGPVSQQQMLRPYLPQLAGFDFPAQIGPHQAVLGFSIYRELLALHFGQAVFTSPLQHELSRLIEFRSGGYAMQSRQIAQIFVRGGAAGLVAQFDPLILRKERLLGES